MLAINVNSPSAERAERQRLALISAGADVLVLTEVKKSAGGEALVNGLRADGFRVHGWELSFNGFTTLVATKVPATYVRTGAGRIQSVALEATPRMSILAAYGISSDPFGRNSQDKIAEKRKWLRQFADQVRREASATANLLVIGDLNFVDDRSLPQYRTMYDFERQAYSDMLSTPLTDLLADSDQVSWASYKGEGFRYDHAFSTHTLRAHVVKTELEHQWRTGDERVTDHSAVRVETDLEFTPDHGEQIVGVEPPTLF
ncbi:endonuclease/exonuclease/phosphatase family protein [Rathayibacter sp. VKM Ac-2857]|uniref:endonuclease/exonuclease/phosphatase family protein n=1 Tax=Rathayibacter sp. VKM Ac-2857 TaxID=2739020 RepID=UPI0015670FED|nr:endonuclease/exonuclease/phosphatase family protein [Rathayibacter sp. VKM Ac-2857]NQX17242.1 endonuclease/exonuclease/phosphatase family protein [Rathayibacter sp. VKM Ac-2857]